MSDKIKQDISIGHNLKRLRIDAAYTQEQVAAKLQTMGFDISREIISQMELGKYSIRVSVLLTLCEVYNAPIADFFEGISIKKESE